MTTIKLDDPSTKVIEIRRITKAKHHSLEWERNENYKIVPEMKDGQPTGRYFRCEHCSLLVDERRQMVKCKVCDNEMSLLEAMRLLYHRIWWEENTRERQLEYDEKRVKKVQAAAITHLYEAGITPEKYAERWNKERSLRAAQEIKKATDEIAATNESKPVA